MKAIPLRETRSREELQAHYEVEKALADKLRAADQRERKELYPKLYAELFERVPFFSARKSDTQARSTKVAKQIQFLERFLSPDKTFLDIGAGDCALAIALCRYVKKVYALDVANQINNETCLPPNFEWRSSDGTSIDLPHESVDIAFSNQLMEHLHPDDAHDQLENIYSAIAPGGLYIVLTPHRFSGPHDISEHFDEVATGFHLKEYTNLELVKLLGPVGFSEIHSYAKARRKFIGFPVYPVIVAEGSISWLPFGLRRKMARSFPWKHLLGIRLVARR